MRNRFFLYLITIFIFGTACNNDDDDNETTLTGFDRMVDKNYRISDLLVEANGVIVQDNRDLLDCELDDTYRYERSGDASTRFGALKCDPSQPSEELYFWALISNDTKLILDYGGPNLLVYNILVNNGSRLIVERFSIEDWDNNGQDDNVRTTITYVRR